VSGLVCPSCGGQYRTGYTRCGTCDVDLVDEKTYADLQAARDNPRAALANVPTIPVVHAGIAACREIERAILEAGVPCYVDAINDDDQPLSTGGAMKVGVIIAEADLAKVGEIMRKRFSELIEKEGVGSFNSTAIDLAADEIECPACGHKGPLVDGACGDCGLFLGAPE
jgi:hypothetical protein